MGGSGAGKGCDVSPVLGMVGGLGGFLVVPEGWEATAGVASVPRGG